MVFGYRYIDIDEEGRVLGAKSVPTEHSIDTEGMTIPEMPTDEIYTLYYGKPEGLYWKKVGDLVDEPTEPEPVPEPPLTEQEQAILETAVNVDYLVCMKELEI